ALSPLGKVEQAVGLTNISIEYSRPSKRGRVAFPEIVPYGEIWRAGANKNSILTTDDQMVFGRDTVNAGSYAIFIKPSATNWTIYLYKNTENWGTPANWDDNLVAIKTTADVKTISEVETFTIAIDNIKIDGASLTFSWDKSQVSIPFSVVDRSKVEANIKKVLAGPTARDYYVAADYNLNINGDMKQALEWINKAIEMSGNDVPFYFLRKKSLIQANMKDFKGAIETAKQTIDAAKKANNQEYVNMSEA